jgi:hypothetical protein
LRDGRARGIIFECCDINDYLRKINCCFDLMYLDYVKTAKSLLPYISLAISKVNKGGILAVTYSFRKSYFRPSMFECKSSFELSPLYKEHSTHATKNYVRINNVIMDKINKLNRNGKLLIVRTYNLVVTLSLIHI